MVDLTDFLLLSLTETALTASPDQTRTLRHDFPNQKSLVLTAHSIRRIKHLSPHENEGRASVSCSLCISKEEGVSYGLC